MLNLPKNDVASLRLLVARLLAELPAMIAMAQRDKAAGAAGAGLASILASWRHELAAGSTAAFTSGRLSTALVALFALCDVAVEQIDGVPGIHLRGAAAQPLDTAMRLVKLIDGARGSRVGEEIMAALLGGVAAAVFDAASPETSLIMLSNRSIFVGQNVALSLGYSGDY